MENEINWFNQNLKKSHVHGRNISAKIRNLSSLSSSQKTELQNVIKEYKEWHKNNEELKDFSDNAIKKRVAWLNDYKRDIEPVSFSAQSKFHSTVIEEFLYYLFKDLLEALNEDVEQEDEKIKPILLGGIRAYSNLYFAPENFKAFVRRPNMQVNVKDQDFAIYRAITIRADGEKKIINVPVVSIECKTYIDKTMLEGSIATAEKIKNGNPYSLFLVVTEWYDVSYDVDPAYSRIDQIFVLRKQKRRSNHNNPIFFEVVKDLFNFVKGHLERDWSNIEQKLTREGKIL
jgi:hypothetical protein